MSISEVFNCDCMEYMAKIPNKHFDLAIVDPEFGHFVIPSKNSFLNKNNNKLIKETLKINKGTNKEYFTELDRISKYKIVWGGNYFFEYLGNTKGIIIWDKKIDGNTLLSWAEIAWQNIRQQTRIFRYHSGENKDSKFHPNQKPIALYKWLLTNYAKPGWKIFDSHLGSGSSRIAAYNLGFDFWACELDKEYFDKQEERFKIHSSQTTLFQTGYFHEEIQEELF